MNLPIYRDREHPECLVHAFLATGENVLPPEIVRAIGQRQNAVAKRDRRLILVENNFPGEPDCHYTLQWCRSSGEREHVPLPAWIVLRPDSYSVLTPEQFSQTLVPADEPESSAPDDINTVVRNFVKEIRERASPHDVMFRLTITAEDYEISVNRRTAEDLARLGLSMLNLSGHYIA